MSLSEDVYMNHIKKISFLIVVVVILSATILFTIGTTDSKQNTPIGMGLISLSDNQEPEQELSHTIGKQYLTEEEQETINFSK